MFAPGQWSAFFAHRGLDVHGLRVEQLTGGEINDNWRIESPRSGEKWVLRHYKRTADVDELDCELAAVEHLSRRGFPTPAPVASPGGLWETVGGRPAALFTFAVGVHPAVRPGGYGSMDLEAGLRAARLAARMHLLLASARLPGRRSPDRDPWRQIGAFLASDFAEHPLFAKLREPLQAIHERLAPVYAAPAGIPTGLIHNDIQPLNLLVGSDDEITALLDFDDCAQTFLAYDLGSVVGSFGKDEERRTDPARMANLLAAYESIRPFADRERTVVPDLLAARAGAEGIIVLTHWLRLGRTKVDAMDSFSARQFLELFRS